MKPINLPAMLDTIPDEWDPRDVARFNDNDVILIKIEGGMPFHSFPDFDDFFYVLKGDCVMDYEDGTSFPMREGDMVVVPRGVSHRPRSDSQCHLLVIERSLDQRAGGDAT